MSTGSSAFSAAMGGAGAGGMAGAALAPETLGLSIPVGMALGALIGGVGGGIVGNREEYDQMKANRKKSILAALMTRYPTGDNFGGEIASRIEPPTPTYQSVVGGIGTGLSQVQQMNAAKSQQDAEKEKMDLLKALIWKNAAAQDPTSIKTEEPVPTKDQSGVTRV